MSVAAARYGFLPVGLLMHDQFRVDEWIEAVDEPVFVAHGTADRTIAVRHGERVYELAPIKAGLWIGEGADHSDLWNRGIWTEAKAFFEAWPPPNENAGPKAGVRSDPQPCRSQWSSRPASAQVKLAPTVPCTLQGCSAIERREPPISQLAPRPTPRLASDEPPT